MAEILVVGTLINSSCDLAAIARSAGFRLKEVQEFSSARHWLENRPFDALILPGQGNETLELADLLWRKNPAASLIMLPASADEQVTGDRTLNGAETLRAGSEAEDFERILSAIKAASTLKPLDFGILVVDDLDAPREIICAYIEALGFAKVTGVSSAQSALEFLRSGQAEVSCIVSDLKMPGISGQELIRFIRTDRTLAHIPVIVLTAHGTIDALIAALRSGASGFLVKPPRRQDLLRELSRAVRIVVRGISPLLTNPVEADQLRDALVRRGIS